MVSVMNDTGELFLSLLISKAAFKRECYYWQIQLGTDSIFILKKLHTLNSNLDVPRYEKRLSLVSKQKSLYEPKHKTMQTSV